MTTAIRAVGSVLGRLEGPEKVTGQARYAAEYDLADLVYAALVQSTVAKGRITRIDEDDALAGPGVVGLLTFGNAPRLQPPDDGELALLQSDAVSYRGQVTAVVLAETLETAREAAGRLVIEYDEQPHDVQLDPDDPRLYKPDKVNPGFETDTAAGDFDTAFAAAPVQVDYTYRTPALHNNPMEPHATTAVWDGDQLTLFDSTQGAWSVAQDVAKVFGLDQGSVHVHGEHVGGGFGSKGSARVNAVLAAMAARAVRRPVKVVLTRQELFSLVGYRTPTIQRIRLGSASDGRLAAIAHEVIEQTSTVHEFAEQSAVVSRMMYAAPHRRTSHRLARLDVPTPRWMRAPGECPGMYALECAMDELAIACDLDPIELRVRNEPETDPESGQPFSSRNLVACLHEGAERFGWSDRGPRQQGRWLIGSGVAASTYPAHTGPSTARARARADGDFEVMVAAADIGTGARTALTQIAADALRVPTERVHIQIADSDFGQAPVAGGSSGTASWGWAVIKACQQLQEELDRHAGQVPEAGIEVSADTSDDIQNMAAYSRHAFGAQFAEVAVDADTGEVRVPRLLGVFAAGRIVNPRTARSQLLGGMTMGLSMALLEEGILDPAFGDYVNHDLAEYHVAACADVQSIEVHWLDEHDDQLNPMGTKGIGELGIVGTAAAIANAVHRATGIRVRDLPIRLDKLIDR